MKKISLMTIGAVVFLNATTISQLLKKIDEIPDTKLDNVAIKEMKINKKSVTYSLYPKLTLTGSAEHFNIPTSIRPLPPTESTKIIMTHGSLPFSKNIYRIGFNFNMPLFIKEVYDNKKRMQFLLNATKYKSQINLLKRESTLIIYVSNLNYLYALKKALKTQYDSISTVYKATKTGVKVGRIPEFKLLRLKDSLISIKNRISQVETKIADMQSKIYTLTETKINQPIKFYANNVSKGEFISLKPLKEQLKASKYEIASKKDAYLPKVFLKMQGNRAFAKAYNTNENIALNYASAGIYITWDVFNKKNGADIQKAKIARNKTSLEIAKTIKDLKAQIAYINKSLKEIEKQLVLAKQSVDLKKELLKSAKTAFELNTMTVDEYLGYENDLAKAKADLANLIALKNSLIAQKALIYGKNLKKVFK